MDQSFLDKYLAGEASEAEVKKLFQWIESTPENRETFIHYKKVWALTSKSHDNVNNAWSYFPKTRLNTKRNQRKIVSLLKYAAAAIIIFSLGFLAQYLLVEKAPQKQIYLSKTQFEVPLGQMSKVILPDGTIVHLNSGSSLQYSGNFNEGKRVVDLKGEAFFEVAKDAQHPFSVSTPGEISLKVYGTSFNVQAYPNEKEINTTLVEGSLGVIDQSGNELIRLVPGENAEFINADRQINVSEVRTDLYTSWKDGLVTFRNESLEDIARKIERWYNVEIVFENPKLAKEMYDGTIMKSKPIDQILEVFRLTRSLEYCIESRADAPTLIYWK